MISVAEARGRIVAALQPLPPEQVSLADALGRTLAEDVAARRTQPPVAVSAMDGYAVRAVDVAKLPAMLKVFGYIQAGGAFDGKIGPGEAARIFTGAPVPDGADAIVIQENTEADEKIVRVVDGKAPAGRFVRPAGLDFKTGDVLLKAGRVLTARDIGLAAGMNVPWLKVRRKPRIAILATGDEIVMPGEAIGRAQIVSSNGLALGALIAATGGVAIDLGIAPDSADALKVLAAGARGTDMLVTTGGASVGDHDLVQRVLGEVGLKVDFWKIAMRPGKPLIFGQIGATPLLGLPGNAVSAMVCGVIFLAPAIRALLGASDPSPPSVAARLGGDLPENDEREDYLRAALTFDSNGAVATPFPKQDSSMFATMARADCLVIRPPHAPPLKTGAQVRIVPLSGSSISV